MDDRKRRKILKHFGQMLREVRTSRGLSVQELADIAELDRANLTRIENGQRAPTVITLYIIAEALDISPSEFFK